LTTTQTSMNPGCRILGIDIGSVSLSLAEVSLKREILKTAYRFHHGDIRGTLREALDAFDLGGVCTVAATTSTPSILRVSRRYDNRLAIMEAARHFYQDIGSILVVGGEAFGLIGFDEKGRYRSFRTNTSCAAGTGSFLDQQARRLNLDGAGALSEILRGQDIGSILVVGGEV
jgi:activator of 2-hydroxyglutaryl-CoA dehydratase